MAKSPSRSLHAIEVETVSVAVRSIRGSRASNEDRVVALPGVVVLADGIGGHPGGDIAAQAAVSNAAARLIPPYTAGGLSQAFEAAGGAVRQIQVTDDRYVDAGSTLTIVAVRPATGLDLLTCVVAWAGDSPAFLVRDDDLTLLTPPHTLTAELVRAGELADADAETHPGRNTLTRSIGSSGLQDPDVKEFELVHGDRLLVASDGLLDVPDRRQLRHIAVASAPVRDIVDDLISYAAVTSKDNITVAMLDPYADEDDVRVATDG